MWSVDGVTPRNQPLWIKDLANCKRIFINRTDQESDRASGWFCGASDSKLDVNDAQNLEQKSLWELSCDFPQLRDFFPLAARVASGLTGIGRSCCETLRSQALDRIHTMPHVIRANLGF